MTLMVLTRAMIINGNDVKEDNNVATHHPPAVAWRKPLQLGPANSCQGAQLLPTAWWWSVITDHDGNCVNDSDYRVFVDSGE